MEFHFTTASPVDIECDVLVIGKFSDERLGTLARKVDRSLSRQLSRVLEEGGVRGRLGETELLTTMSLISPRRVLLVGMGEKKGAGPDVARKAAIVAVKKVRSFARRVAFALDLEQEPDVYEALMEGVLLGDYSFDKYKTSNDKRPGKGLGRVDVVVGRLPTPEVEEEVVSTALTMAEATNFTRDLVNEPPVSLTPTALAEVAEELASECGLAVTVHDRDDMLREGMGGILAVNKGSSEPPKFIHLTYEPERRTRRSVAVVGKGITFDSGGLSLKPADSMRTMKMDMAGAGAVLGVMKAVARLKPSCRVHGLIPSTENMTGGAAYKVDDVIRILGGKTVEVVNTDAEGRIVLADALSYALRLKVDEIVDLATLTGACIVALGNYTAGLMGNDRTLLRRLARAAARAGEKVWELPLDEELRRQLDSDVADLKNVGSRWGGAITAALFLREFVAGTAWAHIDIAGPAFLEKGGDFYPKGATGFGVRTVTRYLLER